MPFRTSPPPKDLYSSYQGKKWLEQLMSQASVSALTTDDIAEGGTNLYFTTARARASISGTTNQINYNSSTGVISTPQNIHTAATPTFASMTLSGLASGKVLYGGVGGVVSSAAAAAYATSGDLLTLSAQTTTDIPLVVKAFAGQTASLQENRSSASVVLSGWRGDGSLLIQNTTATTVVSSAYNALYAKADGSANSCAFIIDRNRSQTNFFNGTGLFLADSTEFVGMRMWSNSFIQHQYDFEFFSQRGMTLTMPYAGGMYIYNPLVNTQDVSCMQIPYQTIYAGAGMTDPGGCFVVNPTVFAATSANTMNDAASFLITGAPIAGVNMTLTRRYNFLSIAYQATDVTACFRGTTSQSGHLSQWENVSKTPLALINKDGGFTFNESGADTDCRIEGDTDVNLFYTDASTDRVGFGTATPSTKVEIAGVLSVKQGASSSVAHSGGSIFDHYADVKSVTTTETDLYSDTLPASSLGTNGDKLEGVYSGIVVTHATATRRIRFYFGGNVIFDTGALVATTSGAWLMFVHLIRVSSTVIRYAIRFDSQTMAVAEPSITGELTGLTLSNTNVIKVTGQAGGAGAASDDIWVRTGKLKWIPAA